MSVLWPSKRKFDKFVVSIKGIYIFAFQVQFQSAKYQCELISIFCKKRSFCQLGKHNYFAFASIYVYVAPQVQLYKIMEKKK